MPRFSPLAEPIVLAFAGIAFLSAMDAAVKGITQTEPVIMGAGLRALCGALIATPLVLALRTPMPDRRGIFLNAVRGVMIAPMAFLFFYALDRLTMAETITLAFVAPLIVPPLAAATLGEPMRGRAVLAGIAGFLGVLVTVSGAPASEAGDERWLAVAAVLVSAALYAGGNVILRHRAQKDDPMAITLFGTLVPALFLTPLALTLAPMPQGSAIGLGFVAGALGTIGVLLLSRAYAKAEAQILIVLEYTGLGWAALFGWIFFAETVRAQVLVGAMIIAGACWVAAKGETVPPPVKETAL